MMIDIDVQDFGETLKIVGQIGAGLGGLATFYEFYRVKLVYRVEAPQRLQGESNGFGQPNDPGKTAESIFSTRVKLAVRGHRDIRVDDFDDLPMTFELGVPVRKVSVLSRHWLEQASENTQVHLGPSSLRRGSVITIDIRTVGAPHEVHVSNSPANVRLVDVTHRRWRVISRHALHVTMLAIVSVLLGGTTA